MPSRRGPAECQGPQAPARTLTDGLCHSSMRNAPAHPSPQADLETHRVGVELLQPPVQLGGLSSQLVHNGFAFGDAPIADVGFHDLVPVMVDRRNPLTGITCEVSDWEYTANSNRLRPGGQSS